MNKIHIIAIQGLTLSSILFTIYIHWLPDDDDIEYIEKLRQNKKFKFCRVFMI